jgi:hypothetical protein
MVRFVTGKIIYNKNINFHLQNAYAMRNISYVNKYQLVLAKSTGTVIFSAISRMVIRILIHCNIFLNPLLFASCTDTVKLLEA